MCLRAFPLAKAVHLCRSIGSVVTYFAAFGQSAVLSVSYHTWVNAQNIWVKALKVHRQAQCSPNRQFESFCSFRRLARNAEPLLNAHTSGACVGLSLAVVICSGPFRPSSAVAPSCWIVVCCGATRCHAVLALCFWVVHSCAPPQVVASGSW